MCEIIVTKYTIVLMKRNFFLENGLLGRTGELDSRRLREV